MLSILEKLRIHKETSVPINTLTVETSNLCNFRCQMCVSHGGELINGQSNFAKHLPPFIDVDLFKKIADQYKALPQEGTKLLLPQYRGECLMHPKIFSIFAHLEEIDMDFGFTTNASLLTPDKSRKLLANKNFRTIAFSFDGATKETFEKIRCNGKYEDVLANINFFMEHAQPRIEAGTMVVSINYTLQPDNEHEVDQFIANWVDRVYSVSISNVNVLGRPTKFHYEVAQRVACPDLKRFVVVLTNGDVIPCCRDYEYALDMGNIDKTSLQEVWNGKKYKGLRKLHNEGKWDKMPHPCNKCDSWSINTDNKVDVENGIQITTTPFTKYYHRLRTS
ncbi:radical SAM/SPASM domain-containing protein [Cohnella herbarum]|uniref:Radical SAM protein n=1 Tax=Cohnella herbarum TaxID=2728023 RepID=A0A7Z2ZK45_9BACL|nr:SPASM domain-containing protein [Cohnella herbarum]QJD81727.1 radical SAM protein [Cohnella herbarum]